MQKISPRRIQPYLLVGFGVCVVLALAVIFIPSKKTSAPTNSPAPTSGASPTTSASPTPSATPSAVASPTTAAEFNAEGARQRDAKQNDAALADFAQAIKLDPTLITAYQNEANLLIGLQRRPEAQTVLEAGLAANPGNTDLKRDLSVVMLGGGNQ